MVIAVFMIILIFSGSDWTLMTLFLRVSAALSCARVEFPNFIELWLWECIIQGPTGKGVGWNPRALILSCWWLGIACIYSRVLHTLDLVSVFSAVE